MLLTIDLGTTATKAVLWGEDTALFSARAELATAHPRPGWATQEPDDWWRSVMAVCSELSGQAGGLRGVDAIGFSAARETFVPVAADGTLLGPAMIWSDRRATPQAEAIAAQAGGAESFRQRSGIVIDAGSTVAKIAWIASAEPDRMARARWFLAPRDVVVMKMTGQVATDPTLASRTGFYDIAGKPLPETIAIAAERLPPVEASSRVLGGLLPGVASSLGLRRGTPVVIGAGDRPCEVLGSGASASEPMVSWGTTANMSVPVDPAAVDRVASALPSAVSLSAGALGGYLIEAGLSAAGQALSWLAELTGRSVSQLAELARTSPPGANGLVALCWLNGARAPWWRPAARAALMGLTTSHGAGDLAKAIYEGVAMDMARCLDAISAGLVSRLYAAMPGSRRYDAVRSVGSALSAGPWIDILTGVIDLPARQLRSSEAASAGAALVTANAIGLHLDPTTFNPVVATHEPDPSLVDLYRELREPADRAAAAVLSLGDLALADGKETP